MLILLGCSYIFKENNLELFGALITGYQDTGLQIRGVLRINQRKFFNISLGKHVEPSLEPSRDGSNDGSQHMFKGVI